MVNMVAVSSVIDPGFTHYIIFVFSICGIAWGTFNAMRVSNKLFVVVDQTRHRHAPCLTNARLVG